MSRALVAMASAPSSNAGGTLRSASTWPAIKRAPRLSAARNSASVATSWPVVKTNADVVPWAKESSRKRSARAAAKSASAKAASAGNA